MGCINIKYKYKIIRKIVPKQEVSRWGGGDLWHLSACICISNHYDLARFKAIWTVSSAAQYCKPNYFTFPTWDSVTIALNIKTWMSFTLFFFLLSHILHYSQWILHTQLIEIQKARVIFYIHIFKENSEMIGLGGWSFKILLSV